MISSRLILPLMREAVWPIYMLSKWNSSAPRSKRCSARFQASVSEKCSMQIWFTRAGVHSCAKVAHWAYAAPHASDAVRERALAAVDAGHPVADVAAFFPNDPSKIYRWLRERRAPGSGLARPRLG